LIVFYQGFFYLTGGYNEYGLIKNISIAFLPAFLFLVEKFLKSVKNLKLFELIYFDEYLKIYF